MIVTDNFNRASIGTDWSNTAGSYALSISSNTCISSSAFSIGYWNATIVDDQYSKLKAVGYPNAASGPAVRIQPASNYDCYFYIIGIGELYKIVSDVSTLLGSSGDTGNATSVYKLEAIGTALKVYKDGTQILSVTDSSLTSGYVGIYLGDGTSTVDDWEGGDNSTVVTANNSTQVNSTDSGSIVQTNIVTAGNSAQANTSSSGAIVQTILGEMLADNSTQINNSTSESIIQEHIVTAGDNIQANGSTSGAAVMTHALVATDNIQVNTSNNGAITQVQALTAGNSIQVNQSSSGKMTWTPGYWYEEAAEILNWDDVPTDSSTWTPTPPSTSIWN